MKIDPDYWGMKIDPDHMTQPDWLTACSITNYERDLQQLQWVECLLCSPLANLVYCYVRLVDQPIRQQPLHWFPSEE